MSPRSQRLLSGLVLLVFAPGCMAQIDPQTQARLDGALSTYQTGDDAGTVARAESILADHPRGPAAMQALYLRGLAWFRQQRYDQAEADLERVARSARSDDLRLKALDTLGEIDFRRGRLDTARTRLEAVVAELTDGQRPGGHAHYRLGQIAQRQGRWNDADLHLQQVIYHFADSDLAPRARRRVGARAWAVQAGSFAERSHAEKAARTLRQAGLEPTVVPSVRQSDLMFLVQVGRWDRYEEAEAHQSAVRAVRPDAFLHPTR
jgi:tetratricopeptide (TPR) repeat protein